MRFAENGQLERCQTRHVQQSRKHVAPEVVVRTDLQIDHLCQTTQRPHAWNRTQLQSCQLRENSDSIDHFQRVTPCQRSTEAQRFESCEQGHGVAESHGMLGVRHKDIQLAQMMNLRDCANEILVFSVDKIQPKTCQTGKRSPIGFGRSRRTNSFRGDVQRLEGRCVWKECLEQTPQGWGKRRVKLANLQFRKAALVRREAGCALKLSQLRQRGEEKLAVFVDEDIEGRPQGLSLQTSVMGCGSSRKGRSKSRRRDSICVSFLMASIALRYAI